MKKFISLSVAVMLLSMSIAFMACQKTNMETTPEMVKNEVKGSNPTARLGMEFNRTLYNENNPQLINCNAPAGNCASEDVVVYGSVHIQTFQELFNVIEGGNSSAIVSAFNAEKDILAEYLADEHIEGVINEELTVQHKQNSNSGTHFLIFKEGNTIIAAYPVRFQNE